MTTQRPTTKILATMGPASESPHRARALLQSGATAFRMNFSHGTHEEHAKRFATVRDVAAELGRHVPIVSDLQGPKLRCGKIEGGELRLRYGDKVEAVLGEEAPEGVIPIPHTELFEALEPGDAVMIDDGNIRLTVEEGGAERLLFSVDVPGLVSDRKGINIPGRRLRIAALTAKDRSDLAFALDQGTDYIALSFVQSADDVLEARKLVGDRARIISKIEKPSALEDLSGIIAASDGVMVARGDLGVELPLEQVPPAQRRIIREARGAGKLVIVATQMLQSMVDAPIPTRAEASDTAAAVYYGADAVMLSAESAVGRHPEAAVAIMARIIRAASADSAYASEMGRVAEWPEEQNTAMAIAEASHYAADAVGAKVIVASTNSGSTAYAIAQLRPETPVVALTPSEKTARQAALCWGITPVVMDKVESFEALTEASVAAVRQPFELHADDQIVMLAGLPINRTGGTNTLKVIRVGDGA